MSLVCLIGRHGSGKSTIGAALSLKGFGHISVGTLRRLAMHNHYPSDMPFPLMSAIKRLRPNEPLPIAVADRLIRHALSYQTCVLDGFPATTEHFESLPAGTTFVYVWAPPIERERRLRDRATKTARQWTAGRTSARESSLAAVALAARGTKNLIFHRNDQNVSPERLDVQALFELLCNGKR